MRLVLLLVWRFQYYNEIKVLVILEITPSSDHLLRCESGELNPTPGWSGGLEVFLGQLLWLVEWLCFPSA